MWRMKIQSCFGRGHVPNTSKFDFCLFQTFIPTISSWQNLICFKRVPAGHSVLLESLGSLCPPPKCMVPQNIWTLCYRYFRKTLLISVSHFEPWELIRGKIERDREYRYPPESIFERDPGLGSQSEVHRAVMSPNASAQIRFGIKQGPKERRFICCAFAGWYLL